MTVLENLEMGAYLRNGQCADQKGYRKNLYALSAAQGKNKSGRHHVERRGTANAGHGPGLALQAGYSLDG